MTATPTAVLTPVTTSRSLIDSELWERLVPRVQKDLEFQQFFGDRDEETQRDMAERIMEQALGFLSVCAKTADGSLSPSEEVDIGWHTFLMYTREYADFCQRIAGRMIHHAPSDTPGVVFETGGANRATAAMQVHGIFVDEALWKGAADCGNNGACNSCCNGPST